MVRSIVVDCADYYHKLQKLIDDPDLRKAMSFASRQRAEEYYDLRHTIQNTEKLWEKLTEISQSSKHEFMPERIPMIDYCHDFEGYASMMLKDETAFSIREDGNTTPYRNLPHNKFFLRHIEEGLLSEKILDLFHKNAILTIEAVISLLSGFTPSQVRRAIMFLYKYDMIYPCRCDNNVIVPN
jgi:hypothetical protein